MAFSSYAIIEVRSGGASTNSGFFDMNTTLNATLSSANGTSVFPTVSTPNYSFATRDINNYLFIKSGASWTPGWYQITGLAGTSAIVNANPNQYMKLNMFRGSTAGVGTADSLSAGSWTIDYSQNSSASAFYNDITVHSTTTISSIGNTFYPSMIGNGVFLNGNAGITTAPYLITGIAGTIVSLDRSVGISSFANAKGSLGGAISSLYDSIVWGVSYAGAQDCRIYVKADGVYASSGTTIVFGAFYPHLIGYGNYRDDKTQAVVTALSPGTTVFRRWDGTWTRFSNFYFDAEFSNNTVFASFTNNQPYTTLTNCTFKRHRAASGGAGFISRRCFFIDTYASTNGVQEFCSTYGFIITGNAAFSNHGLYSCLFADVYTSNAFAWPNPGQGRAEQFNNVIYNLYGGSGNFTGNYNNFNTNGNNQVTVNINNIVANVKGTLFFNISDFAGLGFINMNNAYYSFGALGITAGNGFNGSRQVQYNDFILNQNPFLDAVKGDFRVNDLPSGGRLIRNNSIINILKDVRNRSFADIGVYETPNTVLHIGMNGGMRG